MTVWHPNLASSRTVISWRKVRVTFDAPRQMCPKCGRDSLVVRTVAASRLGDLERKTRRVDRVECETGCDLSDSHVHGGALLPSDRRRPLTTIAPRQGMFDPDRCDVPHLTLPARSCALRVGLGGLHQFPGVIGAGGDELPSSGGHSQED